MSGEGRPDQQAVPATGLTVGIVATHWNSAIVEVMLERAIRVAAESGTQTPTVVRVAGAVELPLIAQQLATDHDAVVALGVVIRGGTPHFEYVCDAVTAGFTRVSLDASRPVGNGVLTCNTVEEAEARSGVPGSIEDKGGEAMRAALQSALVLRQLRTPRGGMGFGR